MEQKIKKPSSLLMYILIILVLAGSLLYVFYGLYLRDTKDMTKKFVTTKAAVVKDIYLEQLYNDYINRDDLAVLNSCKNILNHSQIVKAEILNNEGTVLACNELPKWNTESDFVYNQVLKKWKEGEQSKEMQFVDSKNKLIECVFFMGTDTAQKTMTNYSYVSNQVIDVWVIQTNENLSNYQVTNNIFFRVALNKLLYDKYIKLYNSNFWMNFIAVLVVQVAVIFILIITHFTLPLSQLKRKLGAVVDKPALVIESGKTGAYASVIELLNQVLEKNNRLREVYEHQFTKYFCIPKDLLAKVQSIGGVFILFNDDNRAVFVSDEAKEKLNLEYGTHIVDIDQDGFKQLLENDSQERNFSVKGKKMDLDVEKYYENDTYLGMIVKIK